MTPEDCLQDELIFLKHWASYYDKQKMEGIAYILKERIFEVEKKIKSLNNLPEKVY